MTKLKHEATLMVGPRYTYLPACSCGWKGEPTHDKGEATRKAYGHVAFMNHRLTAKLAGR